MDIISINELSVTEIRLRNKMRRSRYVEEYCFRKNWESD